MAATEAESVAVSAMFVDESRLRKFGCVDGIEKGFEGR